MTLVFFAHQPTAAWSVFLLSACSLKVITLAFCLRFALFLLNLPTFSWTDRQIDYILAPLAFVVPNGYMAYFICENINNMINRRCKCYT
jgi:uncharacterized RDD family membrane protein YckC